MIFYYRIFIYARHNGVARNYLDIALWVKSKMPSISARFRALYIDIIFDRMDVKAGFLGMPDMVVWFEITLYIALWVKSKMAAICENQKLL